MKLRCQPGDFCLIIRGANSGKFCTVLSGLGYLKPGDVVHVRWGDKLYKLTIETDSGYFWWCHSKSPVIDVAGKTAHVGAFTDHSLWPIRPDPRLNDDAEIVTLEADRA